MHKSLLLLLLPLLLILNSCKETSGQKSSQGFYNIINGVYRNTVPSITVDSLAKLENVALLDARTLQEWEVSIIPGATWVGHKEFTLDKVAHLRKDSTIVVYCSIGFRSERVGELLKNAGYRKVYNLYGSIFEWVNQGHAVVKPDGTPTEEIHAYSPAWGIWLNKGEKVYN